jgi:hypothetical protein
MESVYHIVTIRVNETSWAHVWRLRSLYLGTGYDNGNLWWVNLMWGLLAYDPFDARHINFSYTTASVWLHRASSATAR